MSRGWIGVDLDGTLAKYDGWRGVEHIGEPIPEMAQRVKAWLAAGRDVRIFTARVWDGDGRDVEHVRQVICNWCLLHFGQPLQVTCTKDYGMEVLWDDRAVGVLANVGQTHTRPLLMALAECLTLAELADEADNSNFHDHDRLQHMRQVFQGIRDSDPVLFEDLASKYPELRPL